MLKEIHQVWKDKLQHFEFKSLLLESSSNIYKVSTLQDVLYSEPLSGRDLSKMLIAYLTLAKWISEKKFLSFKLSVEHQVHSGEKNNII